MPFTPIGNGQFRSPSGKVFNRAQVRLWYANGGKFPGEKGPGELQDNPNKRKPVLRIGRQGY